MRVEERYQVIEQYLVNGGYVWGSLCILGMGVDIFVFVWVLGYRLEEKLIVVRGCLCYVLSKRRVSEG